MRKSNISGSARILIDAPANEVWNALTNPELIKQYFFGTNTFTDWQVGSPIVFTGEWEGKTYYDKGTILANDYEKMIRYTYWSSMSGIEDKPENYVTVTYELTNQEGKTLVTVTQENIPDQHMKEHSEQNWNKVLRDLKTMLETQHIHL